MPRAGFVVYNCAINGNVETPDKQAADRNGSEMLLSCLFVHPS